ncbi:MAG TPA: uroporphyrinogen decarboxylase family protein [Spirochaetota bacterium]|nr:uroporphyrinogen decarboxylase family protein [Spirochaetota bacterium]
MSIYKKWKPVTSAPDFNNLLKILSQKKPERPTLFEFGLNIKLQQRLFALTDERDPARVDPEIMKLHAYRNAGYDYVITQLPGFQLYRQLPAHAEKQSFSLNEGQDITDRESFLKYKWPDPENIDLTLFKKIEEELPHGMKVIIMGPGGVLENVIYLTGFENLCMLLYDDPSLVNDIFTAVGSRLLRYYEIAAAIPCVGACMLNDDWGFKTQTMLKPGQLRQNVFPWHKQAVAAVHAQHKPAILHSCGQYETIIEDVITDMQFDGRHSYEDTIVSVEDAYEKLQGKIAVLGGIDVDYICKYSPAEVYERSRVMLRRTAVRGGYALGSGNSIPAYVPDENYWAMITAALEER